MTKGQWFKVVQAINRRIANEERHATYPHPVARHAVREHWNIQVDHEDIGRHWVPVPFPYLIVEWSDGRTWWDEVRVLQYAFPQTEDAV